MMVQSATRHAVPARAAFETGDRRCFTVVVAGRTYGLPVEHIHTVFEMMAVTPVPLAPYEVLGLVNLRGKIATAVSLRRRLRSEDVSLGTASRIAVGIDHRNESFALVVDEVGDVLTLDKSTLIETPPHLGAEGIPIESVHRLDELILPILDLDWILMFGSKE